MDHKVLLTKLLKAGESVSHIYDRRSSYISYFESEPGTRKFCTVSCHGLPSLLPGRLLLRSWH